MTLLSIALSDALINGETIQENLVLTLNTISKCVYDHEWARQINHYEEHHSGVLSKLVVGFILFAILLALDFGSYFIMTYSYSCCRCFRCKPCVKETHDEDDDAEEKTEKDSNAIN